MQEETPSTSPGETETDSQSNDEQTDVPEIVEESNFDKRMNKQASNLDELRLTGDIIEDGKAFLKAVGMPVEDLSDPYRDAFRNNDEAGIIRYFSESYNRDWSETEGLQESVARADAAEKKVLEKIIRNYRNK